MRKSRGIARRTGRMALGSLLAWAAHGVALRAFLAAKLRSEIAQQRWSEGAHDAMAVDDLAFQARVFAFCALGCAAMGTAPLPPVGGAASYEPATSLRAPAPPWAPSAAAGAPRAPQPTQTASHAEPVPAILAYGAGECCDAGYRAGLATERPPIDAKAQATAALSVILYAGAFMMAALWHHAWRRSRKALSTQGQPRALALDLERSLEALESAEAALRLAELRLRRAKSTLWRRLNPKRAGAGSMVP